MLTILRSYLTELAHSFSQEYPSSQDNGENFKTIKERQRGEEITATEERPAQVMPREKGTGL
jgi:hypothetical protein